MLVCSQTNVHCLPPVRPSGARARISRQKPLCALFRESGGKRSRQRRRLSRGRASGESAAAAYHVPRYRRVRGALGKVGVNSAFGSVSSARRGFPAARRRDRNRSVWRPARPHALCAAPPRERPSRTRAHHLTSSLSRGSAPHASHGRPRFPADRPSATWP
ncbi:unnamed protein product, partial [Iphiclides podalirius]